MEIEFRGQHRRRDHEGSSDDLDYTGRESSHGGGSHRSTDKSHETMGHWQESPHRRRHEHHNAALDAMSCVLRKAAWSPFSDEIECTEMPRCFTRPSFTIYNEKTDSVEHISHYIQMMSLYS